MNTPCMVQTELERWVLEGCHVPCSQEHARHAETCASCAGFIEEIRSLREVYAQLPERSLSDEQHARVRDQLVAAATAQRLDSPHQATAFAPRWALVAGLALALTGASFAAFRRSTAVSTEPAPPSAAEVTLVDSAIGHTIQSAPNEVYELVQGLAEFRVNHLPDKQRFRVLVGDEQVEVRGTRFQVLVEQRHFAAVKVFEGRVELTRAGRSLTLDAGQNWVAALPPVSLDSGAQQPASRAEASDAGQFVSKPTVGSGVSGAIPNSTDTMPELFDVAFNSALARLRSGDAAGAVSEFDRLLGTPAIDAGRRLDVLYWSAVAYHRSGNHPVAEQRLHQLLAASPNGWHSPDAALMLGELLMERGATQKAKPWLARAAQSNRPKTSARAKQLLSAQK